MRGNHRDVGRDGVRDLPAVLAMEPQARIRRRFRRRCQGAQTMHARGQGDFDSSVRLKRKLAELDLTRDARLPQAGEALLGRAGSGVVPTPVLGFDCLDGSFNRQAGAWPGRGLGASGCGLRGRWAPAGAGEARGHCQSREKPTCRATSSSASSLPWRPCVCAPRDPVSP